MPAMPAKWRYGGPMITTMSWSDDKGLTVTHGDQTMTASGEDWLRLAVDALSFLPGKINAEGTGFLFAPSGADPDMIGQLVATMLKNSSSQDG